MSLILRDELVELTGRDLTNKLEENLQAWTAECATKSDEELAEAEKELLSSFDENDKYLKAQTYALNQIIKFEGEDYKASSIADYIVNFLSRLEVDWKSSLGIYQAIKFWKTVGIETVPYAVYDATIRLLGTLKYRGFQDCKQILIINDYLAVANKQYNIDVNYLYYLSGRHKVIMDAQQKLREQATRPIPEGSKKSKKVTSDESVIVEEDAAAGT